MKKLVDIMTKNINEEGLWEMDDWHAFNGPNNRFNKIESIRN